MVIRRTSLFIDKYRKSLINRYKEYSLKEINQNEKSTIYYLFVKSIGVWILSIHIKESNIDS